MWCPRRKWKFLGHAWIQITNFTDSPYYGETVCYYCQKPKEN